MKLSICIETIFREVPFLQRVEEVRKMGFSAFEFWGWEDKDIERLEKRKRENQLEIAIFSGNRKSALVDPTNREKSIQEIKAAIKVARKIGCDNLMILTDSLDEKGEVIPLAHSLTPQQKYINVIDTLIDLTRIAEKEKITLMLEPLNTLVDHRGYYLDSSKVGFNIISQVGSESLKLLYDVYHMGIMGDKVIEAIRTHIDKIGYVHIADVPGRGEPGTGEIDFYKIRNVLEELGYSGFVGFEFFPSTTSWEAVKKAKAIFDKKLR
ncbi:hypothetical protein LCGC14_3134350 [marine sediment metagenome]|uniref:Xylose isomerase-like TIM barrel domain-containing protein n=1 Tax=marine sediment metagenome TaxID=412755 RepID=A0A0F8Y5T2_9ZZZZ